MNGMNGIFGGRIRALDEVMGPHPVRPVNPVQKREEMEEEHAPGVTMIGCLSGVGRTG